MEQTTSLSLNGKSLKRVENFQYLETWLNNSERHQNKKSQRRKHLEVRTVKETESTVFSSNH